ncbi:hypothetical protein Syun_013976 [Stephania yunnanensis]|uniref:Uncharacterized protein n=1 Tax=Stephania yunnanensis TaxID=152371 RepID=A0AAP0JIF1_9MAGN
MENQSRRSKSRMHGTKGMVALALGVSQGQIQEFVEVRAHILDRRWETRLGPRKKTTWEPSPSQEYPKVGA